MNVISKLLCIGALLLLNSVAMAQAEQQQELIETTSVKAVDYQFTVSIDGKMIADASTTLAIGVPATLTYQNKEQTSTYRIKLLAMEFLDNGQSHPMITHHIYQNVGGNWQQLLTADIAFQTDKPANMTLMNESMVEVMISGKSTFAVVEQNAVKQLLHADCEDGNVSYSDSLNKDTMQTDCCGGRCNGGHYYQCCGVIKCCACGGGCCTTRK